MKAKFTSHKLTQIPLGCLEPHPKIQRGLKESWANEIANNFDADKLGFLSVVPNGGSKYYVWDGMHRQAGMKKIFGPDKKVPVVIYNVTNEADLAELFIGRNSQLHVGAIDLFNIGLKAGHPTETAIQRVLDKFSLKVVNTRSKNSVRSPAALIYVYERYGIECLQDVVSLLHVTWPDDPGAYEGIIVRGLGTCITYAEPKMNLDNLRKNLMKATNPAALIGESKGLAKIAHMNLHTAICQNIMSIYNRRKTGVKSELSFSRKKQES